MVIHIDLDSVLPRDLGISGRLRDQLTSLQLKVILGLNGVYQTTSTQNRLDRLEASSIEEDGLDLRPDCRARQVL